MFYRIIRALPWWLRLALFAVIAAPLVNMHLVTMWAADETHARILAAAIYTLIIWAFIVACVGWEKFFAFMSAAAVMCVAAVIIGGAVRWVLGMAGATDAQRLQINVQLVDVAFMLMTSLPYAFFVIQAFSASQLLEKVSRQAGTKSGWRLNVAVWLRVFQHLSEMFPALLLVWKEENPSLLLPRHTNDWRRQNIIQRIVSWVDWGCSAAMTWARCLLVFSLRVVPVVNVETARAAQIKEKRGVS